MLIRCTDLALLSLGNVEHGVGEQEALQNRCRVLRQMPDLVHQEVAGAGQVEVVGAGLSVQVPRQRMVVIAIFFRETLIAPRVAYPNRAKRGLLVGVGEARREDGPVFKRIRVVCWRAVLRVGLCLRGGVAKLFNLQLLAAEHDVLLVFAVRAAGGQKHTDGIRGRRGIGIHIALIAAHQLVHIEVAAARIALPAVAGIANGSGQPAVDVIIPCGAVVRVDGALIEVGAKGIVIGAGVGVHGIVPSQETVAVGKVVLEHPVRFARQVGFLRDADAPAHAVHAVVALGVHHIPLRVGVKAVAIHDIRLDVHVFGCTSRVATCILFQEPAVRRSNIEERLIHGFCIRHIRIQEGDGLLILGAGGTLDVVAVLIRFQLGVGRDGNCRAGAAGASHTEVDGFPVPFAVDFEHPVSQVKALVLPGCPCGFTVLIKDIRYCASSITVGSQIRPITSCLRFCNLAFC